MSFAPSTLRRQSLVVVFARTAAAQTMNALLIENVAPVTSLRSLVHVASHDRVPMYW
jgi:hypothetical protein